jgi:hypothetical protein
VVLLLLAGCVSAGAPLEELHASRAALARAVDAGAERSAPRELALAREKIRLAERCIDTADYVCARWLVEQARVDAELAGVRAAAERARGEAERGAR